MNKNQLDFALIYIGPFSARDDSYGLITVRYRCKQNANWWGRGLGRWREGAGGGSESYAFIIQTNIYITKSYLYNFDPP